MSEDSIFHKLRKWDFYSAREEWVKIVVDTLKEEDSILFEKTGWHLLELDYECHKRMGHI
jgi:hypothetical protein